MKSGKINLNILGSLTMLLLFMLAACQSPMPSESINPSSDSQVMPPPVSPSPVLTIPSIPPAPSDIPVVNT